MKRLGTISLSLTRVSDNICHRILICIIAVLVSSSVASAYNPNDYDFEVEGLYYKITGNTEVTLQKVVNPDIEVLSIPSSVIDPDTGLLYSVTRIGDVASGYGTSLKNVTKIIIPESIVQIGSYAFSGCESLESVSISRIINIGIYAFSSCEALKAVEFASKESSMPVSIGDGAFANCKSLIAFKIPEGVVSLGAWAFYNCVNLSNIEIPASLTKIDFYSSAPSFKGCNNLEAITIDTENPKYDSRNGCNAIIDTESNRLILGCGNTVIPNTVSKIGERAFHGCNTLTEIVIPGTVSEIENEAFLDCVNLIDVRSSAMNIGIRAFKNCKNLIRLTLDTSLQRIGVSAFHSCKSLASVEIPKTVVEIGDSAFFSCGLKEIEIPNTITKISDNMFRECRELEKVIIPASVTAFGEDAFASCVSLKSMEIPETVSDIGKGCFFYCQTLSNISIPKTITNIKAYTFNECPKLTNIKFPESIKEIGKYAFRLSGLTDVTIPASVASVMECAFMDCDNLKEITILPRVTTLVLGDNAFYNSKNINTVNSLAFYPPECKVESNSYYHHTFEDCVFKNATLYVQVESRSKYRTHNVWGAFKNIKVYGTSGIEDVGSDDGMTADEPVEVFNMSGVKVADSTEGLPAGIYFVRQGAKTTKLAVR